MSSPEQPRGRRRVQVHARIDERQGVFMISVAAQLADMHPQTLRMYEARGLINPQRSPKNTRLYSHSDVERLRRIQELTTDQGLNLAGVEAVLGLERRLGELQEQVDAFKARAAALEQEMADEVERVRRSFKAEIVPYEGTPRRGELVPEPREGGRTGAIRIPVDEPEE